MEFKKAKHLENVRYEIRGKVAAKAQELKYKGINILELNIGNPGAFDFRVPDVVNMAIIRNLEKAAAYSDSQGIFSAREAIVIEAQNQGIDNVNIDHVFIGNGVSELILIAMEGLLNPGDEMLIPSPDYPLWTAAVQIANGKSRHYLCNPQKNWSPDLDHLESLITKKTKGIVVINPNNPTGSVYSDEILKNIHEIAEKHGLIIFSDEIYSKILFDGHKHTAMASLPSNNLVVTLNGLSKNYRACGFRVGWLFLTGPVDKATDYINGIGQLANMRLCSNVPGQWAIQTALGGHQSIEALCKKGGRLFEQRNLTTQRLKNIKGIKCVEPMGSLYAFPEIDLSMYNFENDEDFVLKFLEEKSVLLVQGRGFNYQKTDAFRVTFLPHLDTLNEAFDRLEDFLKKHRR